MKRSSLTLIDLAEDNHARELCFRVVRDAWVEDEDAYLSGQNAAGQYYWIVEGVRMSPPDLVGTSTWLSWMSIVAGCGSLKQ